MNIIGVFHIKGRGQVVTVKLDVEPRGRLLRRVSDGQTWEIRSIESRGMRAPRKGDEVGLLLSAGPGATVGDEVVVAMASRGTE